MDILVILLFLAAAIVGPLVLVSLGAKLFLSLWRKYIQKVWKEATRQLGLELKNFRGPAFAGTYRGRSVQGRTRRETHEIKDHNRRRKKVQRHYTTTAAELKADCWQELTMADEGAGGALGNLFGDASYKDFEELFELDGQLPQRAKAGLQSQHVREALRQLAGSYHEVTIEDGWIEIECQKRLLRASSLVQRADDVVDAAELMDEAVGVGSPSESNDDRRDSADPVLFPDVEASSGE